MILVRYLECELTECRTVSSEKYHRQTSHTATERAGEGSNIMGLQFDKVLKSDSNPSKFTNLFHRYLLCFTWLQISDKYSCNLQVMTPSCDYLWDYFPKCSICCRPVVQILLTFPLPGFSCPKSMVSFFLN